MTSLLAAAVVCWTAATAATPPDIVPRPVSMELREGSWTLHGQLRVAYGHYTLAGVAEWLREYMEERGAEKIDLVNAQKNAAKNDITLALDAAAADLGDEGYALEVTPEGVMIRGLKPAGVFHGLQTLLQLPQRPAGGGPKTVTCMTVRDVPRFGWRGLMLDCSRTFLTMDYLHRYVDLLAMHKMNVLHLHLTDEQGWRVEIKKHPELTDIGAKWDEKYPEEVSGYYTQNQLRELVKYAADRFVTIIPEIEMPSHCLPVLKAHPELSCRGEAYRIVPYLEMMKPGVTPYGVMCAGNDATFALMEDVIAELADIFPAKYIHIGGDECPKEFWAACPKCQARKRAEGLKDDNELQSWFVKRIEKIVNAHGRTLLGWDEILEGGLAPNAAVMSWRGVQGGIAAAQAGHTVVMSPTTHCYFDYDCTTTPVEKVYAYEPIPPELTPEQGRQVLGAQANMWTHLARNEKAIDEQIFPRLCALAEVVWSPAEGRNWDDFQARMMAHGERLKKDGVSLHHDVVPPGLVVLADGAAWVVHSDGSMQHFANGTRVETPAGSIRSMVAGPGDTRYFVGGGGGAELVQSAADKRDKIDTGFPVAQVAADEDGGLWAVDREGVPHVRTNGAWQVMPGKVRQLAASRGHLWALGTAPVAGGYDILEWNRAEWKLVSPGAAGIQLSAADGVLWTVNGGGVVWKWDGTDWTPFMGPVHVIAAGANGMVWGLRLDSAKNQWLPLKLENGAWVEAGPPLPPR